MTELTSFGALVLLTIGITEVLKRALGIEKRFQPLTALIVGIILTFIGSITGFTSLTILTGTAVGLSASGLFDQGKLFSKKE